ncbi:hypothetical protein [Nitrosospira sp. Is2]|uniref:hypothetical protein n=1 Tax=Nitrosospira sp. Is2 TaxID=3080532 RepID=UPI0029558FE7|nr:hypothetical protein [Nitrosospira sp. Is2]WON74050.1 hypothetical protein R5L00_00735 [Nitrosospira sp. Is2]
MFKKEETTMNNTVLKTITIFIASTVLAGCATIMGQSAPEALNVRSAPDQANIVIIDETGTKIFEGKTPTSLPLEKKKAFFSGKKYTVTINKDGHAERAVTVDTKVNGWYVANILFGGVIGLLIVDPATGAMWTLETKEINVTLEASKQSAVTEPDKVRVVLLKDVPLSFRDKMVLVSQ